MGKAKIPTNEIRISQKANQDKKIYAALKEIHTNDFMDFIIEEEKRMINYP
jgi:hypothetical protein